MTCGHGLVHEYVDDNGIRRCWICDDDLRTEKGDV